MLALAAWFSVRKIQRSKVTGEDGGIFLVRFLDVLLFKSKITGYIRFFLAYWVYNKVNVCIFSDFYKWEASAWKELPPDSGEKGDHFGATQMAGAVLLGVHSPFPNSLASTYRWGVDLLHHHRCAAVLRLNNLIPVGYLYLLVNSCQGRREEKNIGRARIDDLLVGPKHKNWNL